MTLAVTPLGADATEWDAFVRCSEGGSPFHLVAWKRVIEKAFGLRPHYLQARRGHTIEGVLPLFEVRNLAGSRALISVPYAVYGGICAVSDEARQSLVDAAADLGRRRGARYVELRQRQDLGLGLPTKALYVTFTRAIAKDDEENARLIPRKQRRMTRQGAKHGLRAAIGRDHLDAVYDIYARSVHALGSPVYPRRLFHAIHEVFDKDSQVVSVFHGERLVAGVLTLFFEDQVLPYYGGDLRDKGLSGVADFMYWELLCHGARAGYRVFDFGRSREGTGSYDFKRHWGFEPEPLPYQYVLLDGGALPNFSPSNPRYRLATETWKRVPPAVADRLGPFITRFLP